MIVVASTSTLHSDIYLVSRDLPITFAGYCLATHERELESSCMSEIVNGQILGGVVLSITPPDGVVVIANSRD